MNKHVFIVGPAGSGKSQFARMLNLELGRMVRDPIDMRGGMGTEFGRIAECGDLLIRRLAVLASYAPWPQAHGADAWIRYISGRKDEYRPMLRALGDQLAIDAPGRLLDECADNGQIVIGARRRVEVLAFYDRLSLEGPEADKMARQSADYHGDAWIYIDRPDMAGLNDSFDRAFFKSFCSHQVKNDGDLVKLEREAGLIAAIIAA